MPTIAITRAVAAANTPSIDGRRMVFIPADGSGAPVAVPYAPSEVSYDALAAEYASVPRAGLTPLLVSKNPQLPTLTFTLVIAKSAANPGRRVQTTIDALKAFAKTGTRLRVVYASAEAGLWRITKLSADSVYRHPETSEITHAKVSVELTQASDLTGFGPVTNGPSPTPGHPTPAGRTHRVTAGDSLWSISIRYYHTPNMWRRIADTNGITHVRSLPVGRLLRLP